MARSSRREFLRGFSGLTICGDVENTAQTSKLSAKLNRVQPDYLDAAKPEATGKFEGAPSQRVLFDRKPELIGSIPVQGEEHAIIRYPNLLPDAEGLEIYSNGTRITDQKSVKSTFYNFAWYEMLNILLERRNKIRKQISLIQQRTSVIERTLSDPERALQNAVNLIEQARNFDITEEDIKAAGISLADSGLDTIGFEIDVWDIATTKYPFLETVATTIEQVHTFVEEWQTASAAMNTASSALVRFLRDVEDPKAVNFEQVDSRINKTGNAIRGLRDETQHILSGFKDTTRQVNQFLSEVESQTEVILNQVKRRAVEFGVPKQVVNSLSNQFESWVIDNFIGWLKTATTKIKQAALQTVLKPVKRFDRLLKLAHDTIAVSGKAQQRQSTLKEAWKNRQDADQRVHSVVTLVASLALLTGMFVWTEHGAPEEIRESIDKSGGGGDDG